MGSAKGEIKNIYKKTISGCYISLPGMTNCAVMEIEMDMMMMAVSDGKGFGAINQVLPMTAGYRQPYTTDKNAA